MSKLSLIVLLVLLGLTSPVLARADSLSESALKQINFEQKLGAQVSLDLQFYDESGKVVRLGHYFGKKPVILVLGYYGCPMLCTFVLNSMTESLQNLNWEIGNQFDVINVSIDPAETPALAAAKKRTYVRRYGRHDASPGWHFLTGAEPAIRKLADEIGFTYAYDSSIKQYAHPSGLVFLSPQGRVTHYLSGVIYSSQQLNDALVEASASKVGSPVRQFFVLCFHYSPLTGKYGPLCMIIIRIFGIAAVLALAGYIVSMLRRESRGTPQQGGAIAKTG